MKSHDIRINILNNKKWLENVERQFHGVLHGAVDYQTQICNVRSSEGYKGTYGSAGNIIETGISVMSNMTLLDNLSYYNNVIILLFFFCAEREKKKMNPVLYEHKPRQS